jgi:hypothetical protein
MPLKLLVDEQVNPRVAKALRDKGVTAIYIHDLGLAGTGLADEPLLELAISREETLLTLDEDFPPIHAIWQREGKNHYGIFYGSTDKYQRTGAIGALVEFIVFWHEVIEAGAGTLEEDVYNKLIHIQES